MPDDEPGLAAPDVISRATGILMERYGWTADGAGAKLVDWYRRTDVAALDISFWLMDDAAGHRAADHRLVDHSFGWHRTVDRRFASDPTFPAPLEPG